MPVLIFFLSSIPSSLAVCVSVLLFLCLCVTLSVYLFVSRPVSMLAYEKSWIWTLILAFSGLVCRGGGRGDLPSLQLLQRVHCGRLQPRHLDTHFPADLTSRKSS